MAADNLHKLTRRIVDTLDEAGCWYETFHHRPVRTSEEAAAARPGYSLNQGAKAIILRVKRTNKDKFFVMLVFQLIASLMPSGSKPTLARAIFASRPKRKLAP